MGAATLFTKTNFVIILKNKSIFDDTTEMRGR